MRAVDVAQSVERSLPTVEVCSSNPAMDRNLYLNIYCQLTIKKTKIKKKRPRMAHLKERKNVTERKKERKRKKVRERERQSD